MKRSSIIGVSTKKRMQLREEKELTSLLYEKQSGLCADCNRKLGWGSAKHEIIFRSQGGSPTEESNCVLLCLKCHNLRHGIKVIE